MNLISQEPCHLGGTKLCPIWNFIIASCFVVVVVKCLALLSITQRKFGLFYCIGLAQCDQGFLFFLFFSFFSLFPYYFYFLVIFSYDASCKVWNLPPTTIIYNIDVGISFSVIYYAFQLQKWYHYNCFISVGSRDKKVKDC